MSSFKTKRPDKPALPEVLDKFVAYYLTHFPMWGLFHVILDDGNVEKEFADLALVDAQRETAARNGGWGSKSGKERRGWKIERCPCGSLVWRKGDEMTGHECTAPVAVLKGA